MKSIPQIAEALDLSSTTIREYINRFNEFFADPVAHEGVKEYPDDTQDLVERIHGYYTKTEMTKDEIRVKLGGGSGASDAPGAIGGSGETFQGGAALDAEQFKILTDKLDHLISVMETLTESIVKAGELGFMNARKAYAGNDKLKEINAHITEILEMSKGEDASNLEKNVLDADGSIIFSFGRLSPNGVDTINFAKAHKKPWIHIDLETETHPGHKIRTWLDQFDINVLNVAGRSAAKVPGLKKSVQDILDLIV
jgi:hypothetical protein